MVAVIAYKSRSSDLRSLLKVFKLKFDDVTLLSRYEPTLRRILYLSTNPQDQSWRAEALHQLALMHQAAGNIPEAEKYYVRSLAAFNDYELLGTARVMRDYGLFVSQHSDAQAGLSQTEQALALHAEDTRNAKGERQRRITESYVWRARLLVDCRDAEASESLIEFALSDCRDCSLRDQQQVISFALSYASGFQHQLLVARMIEINAKRRNLVGVGTSMVRFIIDTELLIASKLISAIFRKE